MLILFCFNWRTWLQFIFVKPSRNDWLSNFSQSCDIMLYLVGGDFGKNFGSINNCRRWSDILDEMFPDIALLISEFGILQKILSIRVLLLLDVLVGRRIWGCNKLNARSSRKVLTCYDVSKFNRSMLKSPMRTIVLLAFLDRLSNDRLRLWSLNVHISMHRCL